MNSTTRFVFVFLVAAIVLAGLAAIALLWEQDDEVEPHQPLATVAKFEPNRDGTLVPAVTFENGERRRLTLAEFRGQIVVLNFWATWCAPCIRELPSLDRLQAQLAHKGVKVVALSLDRDAEAVRDFFADNGIHNLEVYVDPTMSAQEAFKIPGLPTTVLIDREGRDRGRLIGPADWQGKAAARLVTSAETAP